MGYCDSYASDDFDKISSVNFEFRHNNSFDHAAVDSAINKRILYLHLSFLLFSVLLFMS